VATIYVIAHDGGCEGYSAPIIACQTEAEARALMATMDAGGGSCLVVFATPVWPEPATTAWHNVEPLK
jgi:hypothetical protein